MAKRFVPNSNKKYLQTNRTDVYPLANLWSTYNIDFSTNVGSMRISPRLRVNTATASDADLGIPVAFKHYGGKIWAICDTHIFTSSGEPDDSFSDDATTDFRTDYNGNDSDLELFNGTLCATTTDELVSTDGSVWTPRDSLNSGGNHVMTYFKKFDRLYYSNLSDNILSISSGWATADPGADYAISLSTDSSAYTVTSMKASTNFVWIGVADLSHKGTGGKVLQWDGISPTIQAEYPLGNAQACMSIQIDPKTDSPVAMGSDGILYGFNGAGFQELGRLPFGDTLPYNIDDSDNERFMHPNGMFFTKDGTLLALINNRQNNSSSAVIENLPSGIWEFNKDIGFTHRYSVTYNALGSSTITDYGQNRVSRVGAIAPMQVRSSANVDGRILAGVTYYTDASSSTSAILTDNTLDTIRKSGYFVTCWFESDEIEDNWLKAWAVYRRFLNSTDRMVFKYRLEEEAPIEATITWVDTTHFTTTTDVSGYDDDATGFDGTYGGEVEILRGAGCGVGRHITNVAESGGTYTVTLDTEVTGVTTGTATARFQKWVKLLADPSPTTNAGEVCGQVNSYTGFPIAKNSPRIQIKGYMEWTGKNEFHKLGLYSTDFLEMQG